MFCLSRTSSSEPRRYRLWSPALVAVLMLALSVCFALLALLCGCSGPVRPVTSEVRVTSFSPVPGTEQTDLEQAIRIRFDRPAVAGTQVGRLLPSAPVAIFPPLKVAASWADRQTLVLRPLSRLRPSTRYRVALQAGPGLSVQGTKEFSFVHRPLVVEGLSGVVPSRVPPLPDLVLRFNQPVLASEAAKACNLRPAKNDTNKIMALLAAGKDLVASAIHLRPASALRQGMAYELGCANLRGQGGDTPMERPFSARLHTYPPLTLLAGVPRGGRVPADEVRVSLQFSTPLRLADLRRAVALHPYTPGIRNGTLDSSGTRYTAVLNLKTTTDYTLRIKGDLADLFGQRLGRPVRFSFSTSDAAPRLVLETGIYAVEPASEGYPVWTRNVGEFSVSCAAVPRERVVRLLTSEMNYDPWYSEGEDRPLDFSRLGLRRRGGRLRISQAKNKWQLTRLRLNQLCGGGSRHLGLYLAELHSDHVTRQDSYYHHQRRRVLANITNLGVLLKVGPASGLVWVTGLQDGRPVPGAAVTLMSMQGKRVFAGSTDRQGVLRVPGSTQLLGQVAVGSKDAFEDEQGGEDYDAHRSQRLIALVEKGDDLAVVDGNWQNGIQVWNFGVPVDRSGGRTLIRGFIQSDRGIYRPGETVHFKGLVREIMASQPPTLPREKRIALQVEDSRGATVLRRKLRLSPFGGFAFDLPLAAEAPLGDYHVTARISGQTFRETFIVEEFRKVTCELDLRGHERHGRLGARQRLQLEARYLFGAPVKRAQVRWSVQRRRHYLSFSRLPGYTFADQAAEGRYFWWSDDEQTHPSFVTDGEGETDNGGLFGFTFRDTQTGLSTPQDYLVQATITDETDQSTSKRTVITAHPTDLYLGLHAQEYVQAVDMPFAVNTVALTPEGRQVGAEATLTLLQERNDCKSNGTYRSYSSCTLRHEKVWSRRVTMPQSGMGTERILPRTPGEFIIRLEGRDSRGRKAVASTYVWVIGKGEAFWSGDESARLSLVASKPSYEPGETARLVPRAPMAGATALVTLERNGILDLFVTTLASSGSGIEIPIKEHHAPNVYASVTLVRGRVGEGDAGRPLFKMGLLDLRVSPEQKRLQVMVQTEKESYQPGEMVQGTVRVSGAPTAGVSTGDPVRAEVSLSAADEGVLQLIAYKTPDPMKSFYASWGLGIDSATNLNRIARLSDPSELDPEEGGDASGENEGPRVRSRFVSSAFWSPSLVTDSKGEVRFAFRAPDNLTAFRLMAVAADAGSRFGSGDSRIKVSKPLLAKPVLPRFLAAGDRVEVGVVVHNYTGQEGTATVTARTRGLALSGHARQVRLAADGSARVRFPGTVGFVPRARVRFSVTMGHFGDALELTLPVTRPLSTERVTLASGKVESGKTASVALKWPAGVLPGDSRLEISVDRSGLSELRSGLRYLIEYPYGCLEQTLSRFIPLTKVQDLAASLGLAELQGARLEAFIRAGVVKVIRHQHDNGHFSLWPGSTTYPHLTTYAMFGLNEARRAGIAVDKLALQRGIKAMRSWANAAGRTLGPGGESANMAMAAFVLADLKQPDEGLNARLYEARQALPRYGQAFLLRALQLSGAPQEQVQLLRKELLAGVDPGPEGMLVRESATMRQTYDDVHFYMSSDVRTTAIVLLALLQVDPADPLVPLLVSGLKQARRPSGRWYNTQENIYALVALAELARHQAHGSSTVSLSLDGRPLARRTLRGHRVLAFGRPLSRLRPGTLVLGSTGGPARYAVRLSLARKVTEDVAAARGLSLQRQYLDPQTGQAVTRVRAGELVKVRLRISTAQVRHYVALADPLPAGFEAVNERLATSEQVRGTRSESSQRRYWYGRPTWSHKELRDDRVLAFSDRMAPGAHTVEYLVRATIPGRFTAPPAAVEAMYDPDVQGRTGAAVIEVSR